MIMAGLSTIPADAERKCPTIGKWKPFTERLPTADELTGWQWPGMALICGKVSGNLEMIDFDHNAELADAWRAQVRGVNGDLLKAVVVEKSQSGGIHVIYRCEGEVTGNQKLAQRA
jgi:hypothetical protein